MPTPRTFRVTLLPAKRNGPFISVTLSLGGDAPTKTFDATSTADAVATAARFASDHGKPCQASIRCLNGRKPPHFDEGTRGLYYNLDTAETP